MKLKQFLKTFAIVFALLLGSLPVWGQSFSGSGSGTDSDPYLIYNPNHLNDVHNFIGQSGVVFKLMANIDLSSWLAENNPTNGWLPIGTEVQPFKGKFLGNNKTISGLFITRASTNDVGFFGYTDGATISNLTINGTTVKGADRTGGLCGIAFNSTITSCNLIIGVTGTGAVDVGGFTGNIDGCIINNSSYNGTVTGAGSVAGFTGYARESTLTNITINANVSSTANNTGHCVGYIGEGNINLSNIKASGNINGTNHVGGLVGWTKTGCVLSISNSSINGNIEGTSYIGGVIGINAGTLTIIDCYSIGNINGTTHVGGIIGASNSYFSINGSAHIGDITSTNNSSTCYVGGIIGYTYPNNNIYTTDIDNNSFSSYKNIVNNSYSIGSITSSGDCIGGIIGYQESNNERIILTTIDMSNYSVRSNVGSWSAIAPTVTNGYFWVYKFYNVDAYLYTKFNLANSTSDSFLKKLLDFGIISRYIEQYNYPFFSAAGNQLSEVTVNYVLDSQISLTEISNSYHSGDIYGNSKVGGVIGYGKSTNINTSYSSGKIYANNYVGGITGYLESNANAVGNSEISSCVSANEIIVGTEGNTGRIYGAVGNNVTIGATGTTSANKGLATAKVTSAGVTVVLEDGPQHGTNVGASTLRLKSNYVGMGWDFDNYWKIQETECYPYKASQCAPPKITGQLTSGATSVSGQSIDGGTVVLLIGNNSYTGVVSSNQWTINVPALQSGEIVKACATKSGLMQSYFTTDTVGFAGSGTESDPYLIYTASDLANVNSYSYYKIMNNIDVSSWITANSPTLGWIPIGMNGGVSMKQLDGNGKTISGLWTNSTTNNYGLISTAENATIKNLTINVVSGKQVKGGNQTGVVVGLASGTTFENITINGKCAGAASVAGVAGKGTNSKFNNCSVTSTLTGSDNVGGVVGWSSGSTLSNCTSNVTINGTKYLGGIAGYSESNSYSNCNSSGTIKSTTSNGYVGGIIGKAQTTSNTISKCRSCANVTGTTYIGGLVGNGVNSITESYSSGVVTGTKTDDCLVGGLTGLNEGTIRNCYSVATVTSGQYGAGITGINYGTIDRCYASGNVSAEKWGAGITAYNDGSAAVVTHCFAANNKIQVSDAGGIGMRMIGGFRNGATEPENTNYALNSMEVSINNIPKIVYDDPLEGISVTQAQLYAQATYVNNAWDFTETWGIVEGNGYPYLLALVEEETPDFSPGDVNGDSTIDVADYVDVASYILEQDPQPFVFAAADLDEDNAIDVGDLVGVAYLALNYEGKAQSAMHNEQLTNEAREEGKLACAMPCKEEKRNSECIIQNEKCSMDAVVQGNEVVISLSNNVDITAMQMDVTLPHGMTLVDASLTDRASASHQIEFCELGNGNYRLLAASSALKSFKNNDGAVLTLTFAGSPSGSGNLSNIILASPKTEKFMVDDIALNFNPTGVVDVYTDVRIYREGGNIVIVSPADGVAQLVLPNGMYKTVRVDAGRNVYPAPATGLIIVKMGDEVKKMRF